MSDSDLPTLTDGVVSLRAWREADLAIAEEGYDETIAYWDGLEAAPALDERRAVLAELDRARMQGLPVAAYVIEHEDHAVGQVEITVGGHLSWALFAGRRGHGFATRAVRLLADWALTDSGQGGLGLTRVQARVDPRNQPSLRVATRSGLRREGVERITVGTGDRADATAYVILGRLATDPPLSDPESFRALLNSFLPRKRAIAQMLIRDEHDRVLMCRLTYKRDWDLPGGVVEVGESPRLAVEREVEEELGLTVTAGALLLTDWLPPWSGWDDAICLVFDGGRQPASVLDGIVRQEREIKGAEWADPAAITEHATAITAARIRTAIESPGGFAESGRPV